MAGTGGLGDQRGHARGGSILEFVLGARCLAVGSIGLGTALLEVAKLL